MEAILHSVLLREEQWELLWEAECEQQKQLLHMNTSTVFDILPIQPRKKRVKVEDGLQYGQIPSCYDKENVIGCQRYSNAFDLNCPGTRKPHSRGLPDEDLNVRFNGNPLQGTALTTRRAEHLCQAATSFPLKFPNSLDSQGLQPKARVEHGLNVSTDISPGCPVEVGVVGAGDMLNIPARPEKSYTLDEGNKLRTRGEEECVVMPNPKEEIQEVLEDSEFKESAPEALPKIGISGSKQKMAGERGGEGKEVVEVEQTCGRSQAVEAPVPTILEPKKRGRPKRPAAATTVSQIPQRVTRSRVRKFDTERYSLSETTAEQMPNNEPVHKKPARQRKEPAAVVAPPNEHPDVGVTGCGLQQITSNLKLGVEIGNSSRNQVLGRQLDGTRTQVISSESSVVMDDVGILKSQISPNSLKMGENSAGTNLQTAAESLVILNSDIMDVTKRRKRLKKLQRKDTEREARDVDARLSLALDSVPKRSVADDLAVVHDTAFDCTVNVGDEKVGKPLLAVKLGGESLPVVALVDEIVRPESPVAKRSKNPPAPVGRTAMVILSPNSSASGKRSAYGEVQLLPTARWSKNLDPQSSRRTDTSEKAAGSLITLASEEQLLESANTTKVGDCQAVTVLSPVVDVLGLVKEGDLPSVKDVGTTTKLERSSMRVLKESRQCKGGTACTQNTSTVSPQSNVEAGTNSGVEGSPVSDMQRSKVADRVGKRKMDGEARGSSAREAYTGSPVSRNRRSEVADVVEARVMIGEAGMSVDKPLTACPISRNLQKSEVWDSVEARAMDGAGGSNSGKEPLTGSPVSSSIQKIEAAEGAHTCSNLASGLQSFRESDSNLQCNVTGDIALPILQDVYSSFERDTTKSVEAVMDVLTRTSKIFPGVKYLNIPRRRKRGTTIRQASLDLQTAEEKTVADEAAAIVLNSEGGSGDQQATQVSPVRQSYVKAVDIEGRNQSAKIGVLGSKRVQPTLEGPHHEQGQGADAVFTSPRVPSKAGLVEETVNGTFLQTPLAEPRYQVECIETYLQPSIQPESPVLKEALSSQVIKVRGDHLRDEADKLPTPTPCSSSCGGDKEGSYWHGEEKKAHSQSSEEGKRSSNFVCGIRFNHSNLNGVELVEVDKETPVTDTEPESSDELSSDLHAQVSTRTETEHMVLEVEGVAEALENDCHLKAQLECDTKSSQDEGVVAGRCEAVCVHETASTSTTRIVHKDDNVKDPVTSGKPSVIHSLQTFHAHRINPTTDHLEDDQASKSINLSAGRRVDEGPDLGLTVCTLIETLDYKKLPECEYNSSQGCLPNEIECEKVALETPATVDPHVLDLDNEKDEECWRPVTDSKSSELRDVLQARASSVSREQESYPDVTLTLNRWQFRKRLSPRAKARARRWRSDVAIKGGDHEQGQAADAVITSTSVPTKDHLVKGAVTETFLQTTLDEPLHQAARPESSAGVGEPIDLLDILSKQNNSGQPQRSTRHSGESLCNEVLSQAFQDGGDMGKSNNECKFMDMAVEQHGELSPMPLLESIYTLSRACQDGMASASEFLEEAEQQQVQSLIASANQVFEQLSSKKPWSVGEALKTPMSGYSRSFEIDLANLYPNQLRLFGSGQGALHSSFARNSKVLHPRSITPSSSPASPPGLPPELQSPVSRFPVSTNEEVDVPVISSDLRSAFKIAKDPNQGNLRQSGSTLPKPVLNSSPSVTRTQSALSPSSLKLVPIVQIIRTSDSCNNCLMRESGCASQSPFTVRTVVIGTSVNDPDDRSPSPVLLKSKSPKTGFLHSCSTPKYLNSLAGRPASLKITNAPVVSNAITPSSDSIRSPALLVSESRDNRNLQQWKSAPQSVEGLERRLSTEVLNACQSGSPLGSGTTSKKVDLSQPESQLNNSWVEEDRVIPSAFAKDVPTVLISTTGSERSILGHLLSSTPTLNPSAEFGFEKVEGSSMSVIRSPVSVEEAMSRAGDDNCHAGGLEASSVGFLQVRIPSTPPHHGENRLTEDGAQSVSKPLVAAVTVVDEVPFQVEVGADAEMSLLTSVTSIQIPHSRAAVVAPFQPFRPCSQSVAEPDLSIQVSTCLEARDRLAPEFSPKACEENLGDLKALYLGVHETVEMPPSCAEGQEKIQGSPIPLHQQPCSAKGNKGLHNVEGLGLQRSPIITHNTIVVEAQLKTRGHLEESVLLGGIPKPSEEPVALTVSQKTTIPTSMLRVEPTCHSSLVAHVTHPSEATLPRSNLVSSMRSFIPLVQQQPAAPYPNGKRDVKVKALESAEAAKRQAELKEIEKQERKKAIELAKREKADRAAQEKLRQQQARVERENEEPIKAAVENTKKRAVTAGSTKTMLADLSNQNMLLKVKRAMELKSKLDHDKQERLQEEKRRKEVEWKKREAEVAARKRKREAQEKKEREEKRKRQDDTIKAHREMEERQRAELEEKAQKRKAMEESERERKLMEEELKRNKRIEREKDIEQRRKEELDAKAAWLDAKEATRKRKEEAARQMKLFEDEERHKAMKMARTSGNPAMPGTGPFLSYKSSLCSAPSIGDGTGAAPLPVERHGSTSQSFLGPPLRVLQTTGEGIGAVLSARNSQVERTRSTSQGLRHPIRVPSTGVSGRPLFQTPPEAVGATVMAASAVAGNGVMATASALRERLNILQSQTGAKIGVFVGAGASKDLKPAVGGPPGGMIVQGDIGLQSYEISPFRDSEDEDSEDEQRRSQKPIPQWARKENLVLQLVRQLEQDPDNIFASGSSCSLDEVFETSGSKKRPDFRRRGSSGNWNQDRVTWQEEIRYKTTMGYLH